MCPWKCKRSLLGDDIRYVTAFEGTERDLLLNLAVIAVDSLVERARSALKDELAETMGIPVGCSEALSDPKLARLLPDFAKLGGESVEEENALICQLHESEIVESKLHSPRAIIDVLEPTESGQVSISENDAHAWVAGVNDPRIYLHAFMENLNGPIEQIKQTNAIYQWLPYNREPLLGQLMGGQRIRAKPRRMQ